MNLDEFLSPRLYDLAELSELHSGNTEFLKEFIDKAKGSFRLAVPV